MKVTLEVLLGPDYQRLLHHRAHPNDGSVSEAINTVIEVLTPVAVAGAMADGTYQQQSTSW